jgi:hypothetical protein
MRPLAEETHAGPQGVRKRCYHWNFAALLEWLDQIQRAKPPQETSEHRAAY